MAMRVGELGYDICDHCVDFFEDMVRGCCDLYLDFARVRNDLNRRFDEYGIYRNIESMAYAVDVGE